MKRVSVTNILGQTFIADLEDPSEWIIDQAMRNSWGKPERWVNESECSEEDKAAALETRTVTVSEEHTDEDGTPIPAVTQVQYKLPSEYSVSISDVTFEYLQKELDAFTTQRLNQADTDIQTLIGGTSQTRALMNALYHLCVCVNPLGNFSSDDIIASKSQIQYFLGLMAQVQSIFTQRDTDILAKKTELGL